MAEFEHTHSSGVAKAGLTTGIIGTALSGLLTLGGGMGLLNGTTGIGNQYVTKETFDKESEISQLKMEKALLESEKYTDQKLADIYERVSTRTLALERQVSQNAAEQGVINATLQSGIAVANSNIASLQSICNSITKVVIPNTSVCPGWGDVTIKPVAG